MGTEEITGTSTSVTNLWWVRPKTCGKLNLSNGFPPNEKTPGRLEQALTTGATLNKTVARYCWLIRGWHVYLTRTASSTGGQLASRNVNGDQARTDIWLASGAQLLAPRCDLGDSFILNLFRHVDCSGNGSHGEKSSLYEKHTDSGLYSNGSHCSQSTVPSEANNGNIMPVFMRYVGIQWNDTYEWIRRRASATV